MATILKDIVKPRTFITGAIRNPSKGKGRYDLVPPEAIHALAIQLELGAETKGARNWEKGIPMSSFMDSALRHLGQFMKGDKDEDHLRAALWNVACGLTTRERIKAGKLPKELNDLPGGL